MRVQNKSKLQEKAKQLGTASDTVAIALASAVFAGHEHPDEKGYIFNQVKEQASALASTDRHADGISRVLHKKKAKNLRRLASKIVVRVSSATINNGNTSVTVDGVSNSVVIPERRSEGAGSSSAAAAQPVSGGMEREDAERRGLGNVGASIKRSRCTPSPSPPEGRKRSRLYGGVRTITFSDDAVLWRHQDALAIIRSTTVAARRMIGHQVFSFPPPRQKVIFEDFSNHVFPACLNFIRAHIQEFPPSTVLAVCRMPPAVPFPPQVDSGWDFCRCANLISRLPATFRLPGEVGAGVDFLKRTRNALSHVDKDGFPSICDNEFIGMFAFGTSILSTLGCTPSVWEMFENLELAVKVVINRKSSWWNLFWNS